MTDLEKIPEAPQSEFLLYQTEDGSTRVECRFEEQTIWLTQASMAELFQVSVPTINEHFKSIYADAELAKGSTIRKFRIVRLEGERKVARLIEHYSLETILAVGYRVRSPRGTQFQQWATERLSEYLRKGFVMDDERLKNPPVEGSGIPDYFDELLERIRDIRASERRMYLRVKEIFTMAADYQPCSREATQFFRIIQNKLHYVVSHQTAAEIIYHRSDSGAPNMRFTSTKGKQVTKADVTVAKNYLSEEKIKQLNRIATMWLDFAEDQAQRRQQVFMQDWQDKLDQFLAFNDRDVLGNAGQISKQQADDKAKAEYEIYAAKRRALLEKEGEKNLSELLNKLPDSQK